MDAQKESHQVQANQTAPRRQARAQPVLTSWYAAFSNRISLTSRQSQLPALTQLSRKLTVLCPKVIDVAQEHTGSSERELLATLRQSNGEQSLNCVGVL